MQHTFKIVNGAEVPLTAEEVAMLSAMVKEEPITNPPPTKEQLMAQLQELSAKIQALQ